MVVNLECPRIMSLHIIKCDKRTDGWTDGWKDGPQAFYNLPSWACQSVGVNNQPTTMQMHFLQIPIGYNIKLMSYGTKSVCTISLFMVKVLMRLIQMEASLKLIC